MDVPGFSSAQVLDRPVTGRVFLEQVIRNNSSLHGVQVQLIRRIE